MKRLTKAVDRLRPGNKNETTMKTALEASKARTPDELAVRSASLRNLAVLNTADPEILHSAADMLYDASRELELLRGRYSEDVWTENQRLREALRDIEQLLDCGNIDQSHWDDCLDLARAALKRWPESDPAGQLLAENEKLRQALNHCLAYMEVDADDETEREDYAEAIAALGLPKAKSESEWDDEQARDAHRREVEDAEERKNPTS